MSDLRNKFTENAEQFDSLMVEMLAENEKLKSRADELDDALERSLLSMVALAEYANDELDEEQHKSVFDDINRFRKVLLKEWDS